MRKQINTICIAVSMVFWIFSNSQSANAQNGLHGYIASYPTQAPSGYGEGYGFYSAIWPLIPEPVYHFQIGLPSTWIVPDNSDNTTVPLCPVGTVARDNSLKEAQPIALFSERWRKHGVLGWK